MEPKPHERPVPEVSRCEHRRATFRGLLVASLLALTAGDASAQAPHWVGTWGAVLQGSPAQEVTARNQTVRHHLEISVGGPRLRLKLSNEYGSAPLVIGAASVAIAAADGAVRAGTFTTVRFAGATRVAIPPGQQLLSDPVELATAPLERLAVSLYLPEETPLATYHNEDRRTYEQRGYRPTSDPPLVGAVLSAPGDFTAVAKMTMPREPVEIFPPFLAAVDTVAPDSTPVVVVLGDTKSEGPDMWPHFLRYRVSPPSGGGIAVVNRSQSAGTLTLFQPFGTGLTRFDRDVLGTSGVTHVLLFNASNDINMPGMNGRRTEDVLATTTITDAMRQVVERAHAAGIRVIGATLIPFEGVARPGYATPEHMRQRDEVNAWIRSSGIFDGLVDFDAVVRDPEQPQRLLERFDGGNHFTPSEAGMRALADSIDTALFRP